MKIFIKYKTDGYNYNQKNLDTDLMLYEGHVLPSGKALLRQVKDLQDLGYLIEKNRSIFVLHEPMELDGGQIEYDAVEFNISFIINSSSIAMIFPDRSARGIIEKREKENKEAELEINVGPSSKSGLQWALEKELTEQTEYRDHVCVPALNGQECEICSLPNVDDEDVYIGSTHRDGLTS